MGREAPLTFSTVQSAAKSPINNLSVSPYIHSTSFPFEFICRTAGVCFAKHTEKLGSYTLAMRMAGSEVWMEVEKMGTEAFLAVSYNAVV